MNSEVPMMTERTQAARDYIDACVTDNLWIDPAAVRLATDLTGKELESFIYCTLCDFVMRSVNYRRLKAEQFILSAMRATRTLGRLTGLPVFATCKSVESHSVEYRNAFLKAFPLSVAADDASPFRSAKRFSDNYGISYFEPGDKPNSENVMPLYYAPNVQSGTGRNWEAPALRKKPAPPRSSAGVPLSPVGTNLPTGDSTFTTQATERKVKSMSKSEELLAKLVPALIEARQTGMEVSRTTQDDGTCNFDAPTLHLPRVRASVIEEACRQAGVSCFKWRLTGSWVITGCSSGQANAHTAGAEAAGKVLKAHGFDSGMYYQMD